MCKLCPVKQQTNVNASLKVPRYQPHFFEIVDYLLVPLSKKKEKEKENEKESTAKRIFKMNL